MTMTYLVVCLFILALSANATPVEMIKGVTEPKCFEEPPQSLPGPCFEYTQDVYFDRKYGHCVIYMWGGCGPGGEGFNSIDECQRHCSAMATTLVTTGRYQSKNPECNLPAVTGPCKAYFHSYHYDPVSGHCVDFVYGGCMGNANRFHTLRECQQACV